MNGIRRVRGTLHNAFGSGSTFDICLLDFPLIPARSQKKKSKQDKNFFFFFFFKTFKNKASKPKMFFFFTHTHTQKVRGR